jgi:hypothetical protein
VNKEFVAFLTRRGDDIERLSTDLQRFRNELKKKVKDLQNLVDANDRALRCRRGVEQPCPTPRSMSSACQPRIWCST